MTLHEIRSELDRLQQIVTHLFSEQKRNTQHPLPTPLEVYGPSYFKLVPPTGWMFTNEFRPPQKGEHYMLPERTEHCARTDFDDRCPRYILTHVSTSTITSVYGKPRVDLHPPAGWVFTGEFRVPLCGEAYLPQIAWTPIWPSLCLSGQVVSGPRLILRKRKRLVFDILGENRPVKDGEWFEPYFGGIYRAAKSDTSILALRILSEPHMEEAE